MKTRIEVGIERFRARPPQVVRPPTVSGSPGSVRSDPSTSGSVDGNEQELNMPGTFEAGDLLVFVGALRNQGVDPDIQTPAGWEVLLDDGDVSNPWGVCFYKVADGTETDTTYTNNNATAIQGGAGVTFAIQPPANFDQFVLTAAPLEASTGTTTDFAEIPIGGSGGEFLIVGASIAINPVGNHDITDFSGMSLIATTPTANNDPKCTVASEIVSVTGNLTPSSWTADDSPGDHFGFAFSISSGETATVAPADHTHVEADVTDLTHTDSNAIHDNVASEISAITAKATPTVSDFLLIEDASASNVKKRITIGSLPSSGGSGGGGSGFDELFNSANRPGSEAVLDEFDDESLAGGWSVVEDTSPNITITEKYDKLSIAHPGGDSSAEMHGIVQSYSPAGNFYIETAGKVLTSTGSFPMFGLVASTNATYGAGSQMFLSLRHDNVGDLRSMNNWNSQASNQTSNWNGIGTQHTVYMRLVYTSSSGDWDWYVSPDGISWIQKTKITRSLTISHVGLAVSTWSASPPMVVDFEYFAAYDGAP